MPHIGGGNGYGERLLRPRHPSPALDIKACSAWANMILLATLVVVVLVIVVLFTENQTHVIEAGTSMRSMSISAERAINLVDQIRNNTPPIDWGKVANRSFAQDEDSWVNATLNAKRTVRSIENLVQHVDEARMIERYTALAGAVTDILASPKVANHIETYSDHIVWLLGAMKSDEADTLINVAKHGIRDIVKIARSEKTHEIIDRFMNGEETRQLMREAKNLVSDVRVGVRTATKIVEEIKDQGMVRHADELMQQVRDESLIRKAGDMYDRVQAVESKFGRVVSVGYDFIANLLREEFRRTSSFSGDDGERVALPSSPSTTEPNAHITMNVPTHQTPRERYHRDTPR